MWKLRKYFKPYILAIVGIVVLLFGQAWSNLALPDYMSSIVNYGIQSSGVDSSKIQVMDEDTYQSLLLFMNDEQKSLFESSYVFVDASSDAYAKIEKDFPGIQSDGVYNINKDGKSNKELESLMNQFLFIQAILSNVEQFQEIEANLPVGVTLTMYFSSLPEAEFTAISTELLTQVEDLEDTFLVQGALRVAQDSYIDLQIDMEQFQLKYLFKVGIEMLIITILGAIATVLVGLLAARVAAGYSRDIRLSLFDKVTNFSNPEFDQFSSASLITRTTNDITQIQQVLVMLLRMALYAPILGIGAMIMVLQTQASLTWIIIVGLIALLGLIGVLFIIALPKFKVVQTLLDKLNLVTRESLTGMLVIRAFSNEKREEQRFNFANMDVTKVNMFVNRVMAIMMPAMMLIMNGLTLLIVWFGAKNVDMGVMQVGDMMAFMQYTMQIIMAFLSIAMIFMMLPRASVSAARVAEVLETKNIITDPKDPKTITSPKGVVEYRNVSFKYPGAEENVIDEISFTAKPGETTAFIGSTGSGKSTTVNLLPRFYDVSGGEILLDGVDIRDLNTKKLRDYLGYVPQKSLLFAGTIGSNIAFSNEHMSIENIWRAADIAQGREFIGQKELQLEEPIAQGGTNVSGGQKQRISIARALAKTPNVLVFDDSFSALDFKTDANLRKDLNEKVKEATILLVGQRVASIMHAEQIIVLEKGRIVGKGTHKELMKTCDVYQEIAASQLSKEELSNV